MAGLSFIIVAVCLIHVIVAELPSYIHVCKRNDPKINECIIKSIENLRPRLVKGIPELGIPPMEPLKIPEIVISRGGPLRAVGTDVTIRGASKFEIKELKADVETLIYNVKIYIPFLTFDANYDVNAKILGLDLKGKGPLKANTTDVDATAILKGHKEPNKDGKLYVKFDSLDLKMKLKNYNIQLENLFNGDKALGDAINVALNENKKELINALRPQAERIVSNVLLKIANKVTQNFLYEELFPQ